MKITEQGSNVLIEFGTKINTRVRILFAFEGLLYFVLGSVAAVFFAGYGYNQFYLNGPDSFVFATFFLAITFAGFVFCFYAFARFLDRITNEESLLITPNGIEIINDGAFKKKTRQYDINKIESLTYRGAPGKTDHPLKGHSFDYLGFETQELVIGSVHADGNIGFIYEGKTINFGKDLYSWDAEEINAILMRITERRLLIENIPRQLKEYEYEETGDEADM